MQQNEKEAIAIMRKKKKGFLLYNDQSDIFNQLSDEEAGKLIKHIFAYVRGEKENNPDDKYLKLAFAPIRATLIRDALKYQEKCKLNSEIAKKRWKNEKINANECERILTDTKYTDRDRDKEKEKEREKEREREREKNKEETFSSIGDIMDDIKKN